MPKILFIIGDKSLDIFCDNPLCSKIENNPIHIAYIEQSSNDNFNALFEALSNPVNTFDGSNKQIDIMLIVKRKIQILFIINNMIFNLIL